MEPRFAIFVAHATLKAHQQIQLVLPDTSGGVPKQLMQDAAQFGVRHALARLYPGLVRSPFRRDPLPEVMLTLRYQFEEDPEGLGLSMEESERLAERRALKSLTPGGAISSRTPLSIGASHPSSVSSTRLSKLHLRPSIHGDETPAPAAEQAEEAPLPMGDTRMRTVAGGGVVFPWEKKNR
ncbi:MAG: hypothetical protein JJU11_02295 [Candidatus Sumerlaeia bacterium]|nr:hypothetical protein [Candidatus Sumerlaeia bacterium]